MRHHRRRLQNERIGEGRWTVDGRNIGRWWPNLAARRIAKRTSSRRMDSRTGDSHTADHQISGEPAYPAGTHERDKHNALPFHCKASNRNPRPSGCVRTVRIQHCQRRIPHGGGRGDVRNVGTKAGYVIFKVESEDGGPLSTVDAGGRFLDVSDGLAPDMLTAEVRKVKPWPGTGSAQSFASMAWSLKPEGPWNTSEHGLRS